MGTYLPLYRRPVLVVYHVYPSSDPVSPVDPVVPVTVLGSIHAKAKNTSHKDQSRLIDL